MPLFIHTRRSRWARLIARVPLGLMLVVATRGEAETLQSITNPRRADNTWISDMARVLDGSTERRLNVLLNRLEQRTSAEMAVVTIRRTDGSTPKQFATRLFNHWCIGKQSRNNGVLMLLVMDARRIEVETGRGMGRVLPDDWVQEILNDRVVPRFRDDDYMGGVEAGVQALAQQIERGGSSLKKTRSGAAETRIANTHRAPSYHSRPSRGLRAPATEPSGLSRRPPSADSNPFDSVDSSQPSVPASPAPWWPLASGALLLPVGGWLALRSRIRHCPQCRAKMRRLNESEDDAHLAFDQQFEENLGSMDYRVWRCDACQTTTVERAAKWFSGYEDCPQCRHRTVQVQSTVLSHPTYTHTGESLVTRTCRFPNCGYRDQQRRILPVKQRPATTHHHHSHSHHTSHSVSHSSNNSSGSSGNFGGGSSSGGGAGASW